MPSKLRKAIGAVKDQTSISLAKVTNAANLEVAILKATTHDKNPIEERYVNEILNIVSSNKVYAAACAHCIGKRISKTRNWVVALKSLMIVLRIFQDGDPYFPREVLHEMKRGAKILNLSSFKDESTSSPWDYTAFIRTFSLYLDERLHCFLTGKLQRRFTYHNRHYERNQKKKLINEPGIKEMKPSMVLDKITHWQRLLDRAIDTSPIGSARTNRIVQISFNAIVQESFDLYKDISDGLAVVLDNFFHLPFPTYVLAFNACLKSYKQLDKLSAFYSFCASIGIGRSYEYPIVKKISQELMETLKEFFKDQASFPTNNGSKQLFFPQPNDIASSSSSQNECNEGYEKLDRIIEPISKFGSQGTSLEDLMSSTDTAMSPTRSHELYIHLEQSEQSDQDEKDSQYDDYVYQNGYDSTKSFLTNQAIWSSKDNVSFDQLQQELRQNHTNEWEQQNIKASSNNSSKDCWELVLANTVTTPFEPSLPELENRFEPFVTLIDQALVLDQNKYNPFLDDTTIVATLATTTNSFYNVFDNVDSISDEKTQSVDAQDPILMSTFSSQSSSYIGNLDIILGDMYPNKITIEPTFKAHGCSIKTNIVLPSTFNTKTSDNMITSPSFHAQCSIKLNDDAIMGVQTLTTLENSNLAIVPIHFQAPNSHASTMPPTFNVKNFNGTTLATPIEGDAFGPWPSANTDDQVLNVQEDAWLKQQQLWLEQQKKIISKHLT